MALFLPGFRKGYRKVKYIVVIYLYYSQIKIQFLVTNWFRIFFVKNSIKSPCSRINLIVLDRNKNKYSIVIEKLGTIFYCLLPSTTTSTLKRIIKIKQVTTYWALIDTSPHKIPEKSLQIQVQIFSFIHGFRNSTLIFTHTIS